MFFEILLSDITLIEKIIQLILIPVIVIISLSVHEYAHGFVSYLQGDPTAKLEGRLTLNPLKHLDPIGTVCMMLFGVGWAKPVPVDPRFYKNAKKGMAFTGLAGPLTNLVIGFAFLTQYCIFLWLEGTGVIKSFPILNLIPASFYPLIYNILYMIFFFNLLLAVFNFFPVPPLDGSRVLYAILPDKIYFKIMRYDRVIMLLMLFLLGSGALSGFFSKIMSFIINFFAGIIFAVLNGIMKFLI